MPVPKYTPRHIHTCHTHTLFVPAETRACTSHLSSPMCVPSYLLSTYTCAVPESPRLPDGDHVTTVTLNVPAAVSAWWVVEGPGWAVDDSSTFSVLFQLPTAGGCWERRLRNVYPPLERRQLLWECLPRPHPPLMAWARFHQAR